MFHHGTVITAAAELASFILLWFFGYTASRAEIRNSSPQFSSLCGLHVGWHLMYIYSITIILQLLYFAFMVKNGNEYAFGICCEGALDNPDESGWCHSPVEDHGGLYLRVEGMLCGSLTILFGPLWIATIASLAEEVDHLWKSDGTVNSLVALVGSQQGEVIENKDRVVYMEGPTQSLLSSDSSNLFARPSDARSYDPPSIFSGDIPDDLPPLPDDKASSGSDSTD